MKAASFTVMGMGNEKLDLQHQRYQWTRKLNCRESAHLFHDTKTERAF